MSLKINHNVHQQQAVRHVQETSQALSINNDRLSSGVAADAAVDGGAVVSLTERLRADIAGFDQALQNTEAANSMIQVAEQTLVEVNSRIQRIRALAVKASDQAVQDDRSREAIQHEVEASLTAIDRIARDATFGSKRLFDGSSAMKAFMEGEGFNFVEGVALSDLKLNTPTQLTMQQPATRNTSLGAISFSDVLDHQEKIIISEGNQQAIYVVNPDKGEDENLKGLQDTVRNAGVDVAVTLDGGALRVTHNQFGSRHIFRVQSQTPGLLAGGDDENTQARIRQDVEEGSLERDRNTEFLQDAAEIGIDAATGTSLPLLIVKNLPFVKGVRDDLLDAAEQGLDQFRKTALQNLRLLTDFNFITPSKFALQPQAIIRLNQSEIVDFSISNANLAEDINTLSLGDMAEKLINQMDANAVIGADDDRTARDKVELVLRELGTEMGNRLATQVNRSLKILVGKEQVESLTTAIRKGIPQLLTSSFITSGLREVGQDLPVNATNAEALDYVMERFPDFIDDFPIRDRLEDVIGILNPALENGGVPLDDFVVSSDTPDSHFVNNGRDVIGFFENELGVGDGRFITGTRKFQGVVIRFDGDLEPGDKIDGSITVTDPGLRFHVGNLEDQQALFGLPNIDTTQLARDIKNGSSYSSLADLDFSSARGASDAIPLLDAANQQITQLRGFLGSFGAALRSNATSLRGQVEGTMKGERQIAGTDYAAEVTSQVKNQIRLDQQGAVIAHSNLMPENILRLLQTA